MKCCADGKLPIKPPAADPAPVRPPDPCVTARTIRRLAAGVVVDLPGDVAGGAS
jgi:hypothetical protein